MKNRIEKISLEQGYSKSRLPKFSTEEIEYIKGTYDFFGINHYTTYYAKKSDSINTTKQPSFEHDRGIDIYQDPAWPESQSSWLKVKSNFINLTQHKIILIQYIYV